VRSSVLVVVALVLVAWSAPRQTSPRALPGWQQYDQLCAPCHGVSGDGRGPAAPFTRERPRAFVDGTFAWRSTPIGSPPTYEDLRAAIRHGVPGTSMPGFALTTTEIDQLVDVVRAFAPATFAQPAQPLALGAPPAIDRARGAALWQQLGCPACHGATGFDLATEPLRRPRASDDATARRHAAALGIATGIAGTPMPGYGSTIPDADVWALADHVVALGARAHRDTRTLDAATIAADRAAPITTGTWPGHGDPDAAAVFGQPLAPQGAPPTTIEPSLSARSCGTCHTKQQREWLGSQHGDAASPGLIAQLDHALAPAQSATCRRCHTPLAEQTTDLALRAEGVQCGGCHVRGWTRHGPHGVSPSLAKREGYPLVTLDVYERSDYCMPCHQLPPRTAVNGKPLLDTYREWLEGPYMRQGKQCQDCHMPNRDHTFLGVHDPAMFRRAITLTANTHAKDGAITIIAELANTGAGHAVPTTATPAVWLRLELLDATGKAIASDVRRIGRELTYDGSWHERTDTRILPGAKMVMARAWKTDRARSARVTVEVHPDALYEQIYASRLASSPKPGARPLLEQALARARTSHYIAEQRVISIAR
jgi:mono/diheme cytochrome c family protein